VTARIEEGSLRVVAGACPNLLHEAGLYRYSDEVSDRRSEVPVDDHNHALGALRYLVSRIDEGRMGRLRGARRAAEEAARPKKDNWWLRLDNEALWTPVW
jgi:hypothetical protein